MPAIKAGVKSCAAISTEQVGVKKILPNTLCSRKRYKRITGKQEKKLSLKSIVAVCLSLNLLPSESLEVIHKAGYSFDNSLVQCFYSTFIKERWTLDDADAALFAGTGERFTQMRD